VEALHAALNASGVRSGSTAQVDGESVGNWKAGAAAYRR